jgi:hypothetical protein
MNEDHRDIIDRQYAVIQWLLEGLDEYWAASEEGKAAIETARNSSDEAANYLRQKPF